MSVTPKMLNIFSANTSRFTILLLFSLLTLLFSLATHSSLVPFFCFSLASNVKIITHSALVSTCGPLDFTGMDDRVEVRLGYKFSDISKNSPICIQGYRLLS